MLKKTSQHASLAALTFLLAASLGGAGCGDGRLDEPAADEQTELVAAFEISKAHAQAGDVVTFDASATGGGELSYSWSFGDGKFGGTHKISHIYSEGGRFEATLTVSDATGQTSSATKELIIEERTLLPGDGQLRVRVKDTQNRAVPAADISVHGTSQAALTDGYGKARLPELPTGEPLFVRVEKPGYISQAKRVTIDAERDQALVIVTMQPVGARIPVDDVEQGATVTWKDGARVELPEDGVVDAQGRPVTGAIEVAMTVFNAASGEPSGFPGMFIGVNSEGEEAPIVSHGAIDVTLERDGERLQIAPGKEAVIEIPLYTTGYYPGDSIELWSLDETTGIWMQEGFGEVATSADAPGGVVLRGKAAHFTPWNADTWLSTPCKTRIDLRCRDENDALVELPVASGASLGTLYFDVEPVDGYGDSCTPAGYQRHTGSYRHGNAMPDGGGLEGQMCEVDDSGNWTYADIQCKAADGTYPSDVECNQGTFGSTGMTIGVCRSTANNCPQFMYCGEVDADRDGAIDAQPGCTPPMYRFGRYADTDGDGVEDDGVKFFQNWNGWSDSVEATRSTIEVETPWTSMEVTADVTFNGQRFQDSIDLTPDPPPGFSQLPPPTSSSVGPSRLDTLPEYCTSEPRVVEVGPCSTQCQPNEAQNQCCDETGQHVPCVDETCQEAPEHDICCDETGQQVPCEPYIVVVECNPHERAGENDLNECNDGTPANVCEIDALVIEHLNDDGFTTSKFDPVDVQTAGTCGDADAGRLSSADYGVCNPSAQAWKSTVAYFDDRLFVSYQDELVPNDLLKIYRQAVGANEANGQGELCRASGTINVYIEKNGQRGQPIVSDHYNTFERRIEPRHLP